MKTRDPVKMSESVARLICLLHDIAYLGSDRRLTADQVELWRQAVRVDCYAHLRRAEAGSRR